MIRTDLPDTILDQSTTRNLLEAIRSGVIDMAYFASIYFPPIGERADLSHLSKEELGRFQELAGKIRYDAAGQVLLTRSLKIRLLNAVRAGCINLHADFPELAKAYRAVNQDWSNINPEEREFILDFCIRNN